MSKIETTSKLSLKLISRINLGRPSAGADQAVNFGNSLQPLPQSGNSYPQVEKGP